MAFWKNAVLLSCAWAPSLLHVAASSLHHDAVHAVIHSRDGRLYTSHKRQNAPSIPSVLPGNWTSKGCWTDNVAARTLSASSTVNTTGMTVEYCINFCSQGNFVYAGVEFSQECYCDNFIENGGTQTDISDCSAACKGNSSETCGGSGVLNLFFSGGTPPPAPVVNPGVNDWVSLGCYNDSTAARVLATPVGTNGAVDTLTCTTACFNAGFPLAGTEFADECYCGTQFDNDGQPATSGCNMECAGNSSEFCGGANRLNVYNFTGTDLPPVNSGGPVGGGAPTGAPVFPVTSGLPSPWTYAGCYVDNTHGRILGSELPDNPNVTVETCIASCTASNFTLAGLEFSVQCFCDDNVINDGTLASEDSECSMGCGGNSTEACGGPNLVSLYSATLNVSILPVPVPQNTSLPGNWAYQGCIEEGANGARVFPYENILTNNNSAPTCLKLCSDFGYPAAGLEFGNQCFCGDVSDVTANSQGTADESACSSPCSGDEIHLCGGENSLSLYYWTGTPLNVWHTPEVTGQYEFLIGGLVVPLIATLGTNNKVQFLEKFGTGPPNSTGAYELDLSLADDFFTAWRAMHVKTDVFCSGALTLPDKVGRQINVGGWSLDSTFGVRLYWPDGSPGVNGTNDWQENVNELSLQNGRWYPSAMVMANGSIIVVGGESGSNGPPVPTLEILPRIPGGDTTVYLDFLNRTDPNNLYPFLFVLPGGGVFIIYYNEARILDEVTFETTKTFPNLPGAVNDPTGGRSYPMEGTSVLLPQFYPYTDPLTVLTCGGSTLGPAIALDNCISIQPEVDGATWVLERMPSKRVMTCMVTLPDGTYMIMNGAQQGVAGFGLATDPNLQALLYDPTQPLGQRISILNTTIVDRLYHSEAILLQDGRVLVSGSDPEDPRFPQEYRVEVYIPPYLSSNLVQPQYNISETDWDYNGEYEIEVQLFQGDTSTVKISLVAAVSSTHGNSMNQRILFPKFSCDGNICTITAPPNAHVSPPGWFQLFVLDGPTPSWSQWVRIGGDPAQLGNWPDFSDFSVPGV